MLVKISCCCGSSDPQRGTGSIQVPSVGVEKQVIKSLILNVKFITMDIAVKKVELIEWLARLQDERLIQRIETLRKGSIKELYEQRIPKTMEELQAKLNQSEKATAEGKVHSQEEVANYFKARFKQ